MHASQNISLTIRTDIQDLKLAKGLALGDILTEVHTIIQRGMLKQFCECLKHVSEISVQI